MARNSFSSDPATGLPPTDPLAGFLPPNITAPGGDGQILFTISPKITQTTGQQIQNAASVVFDTNSAITTPTWFNAVDSNPPVSKILALAAQSPANLSVSWQGTDFGSGILDYTIYVSTNGGAYTPWLVNTTLTSSTYPRCGWADLCLVQHRAGSE